MQGQIQALQKMQQGDLFGSTVRVIHDANGEPWFVAKDVCDILGLSNVTKAIKRLDDDERTLITIQGASNGLPVNAVSESGLYAVILQSRKPEAKAFRRWITREVLPTLRKSGLYAGDGSTLPSAMMRVSDYLNLRGIAAKAQNFSRTVKCVSLRSGLEFRTTRFNHGCFFTVAALDKAAEGKSALRGSLCQETAFRTFTYQKQGVAS